MSEVPRWTRNIQHYTNPCQNGFRPQRPEIIVINRQDCLNILKPTLVVKINSPVMSQQPVRG